MYCVKENSSWYISCRPLFGGCPLLGVSVIGGSTVCPRVQGNTFLARKTGTTVLVEISYVSLLLQVHQLVPGGQFLL